MNLEYDDGRITCEHCGKRDFPEVGMSWCDCRYERGCPQERSAEPTYTFERSYAQPVNTTLEFAFIQHQTDKAWLLAFNTPHGLAERWVPKSQCSIAGKTVTLPAWLALKIV